MDEQNKHDGADIKPTAAAGDEANNPDINDVTSPPLVEGPALLPLYKQKRVWIVVVAVVGAVVAMIIILPNTDDQKTAPLTQSQLQERDALVALYDATNGDGWKYKNNWLSDVPHCDWYKVNCNSDGHVDEIRLRYNSLQGTIPTELGLLLSLQYLSVSDNSLQGTIPTELGLMTSLQELWVYGNSLTGTIPSELGLMTSLQYLRVFGNSLTGAVPNEVCALRDSNGGSLEDLWADCEEVECTCCTDCL